MTSKLEEKINDTYWWKIGENGLHLLWAHKALEEGADHLDVADYIIKKVIDGELGGKSNG